MPPDRDRRRRLRSMRNEAAVVRLSWQALSISADKWDAALDTDTGLVTQDFKRRVGALRAQEMAELTKFKPKLRLLEATDPNLICLLHGPDYANSGTIDEHGGLARIAPAAVTIQEVAGDQAPSVSENVISLCDGSLHFSSYSHQCAGPSQAYTPLSNVIYVI